MNRSAASLVKAAEARLLEPAVKTIGGVVVVTGHRSDAVEDGTITDFAAVWPIDGTPAILAKRRGDMMRPVGFRLLMTALKTGAFPETAEDRIREHLGGVYLWDEKATRPTDTQAA